MSSIWTRTLKASPQFDCGLCGFPKCASFTRAAIVGFATIDRCPILMLSVFEESRKQVQNLIMKKTGLRFKTATDPPEGGIVLTRPCKDTDQKVMAELRIHNGVPSGERVNFGVFDANLLCELSECLRALFEDVKCSRDLGYGRVDTGEMSITILQDGRVNMRRVDNEEQVREVFNTIETAILGSTICNCCGNDLASIASGLVKHRDAHTVLRCGSSIRIDCESLDSPLSSSLVDHVFPSSTLSHQIDSNFELITTLVDGLKKGALQDDVSLSYPGLTCMLISHVIEEPTAQRQTLLLRLIGLDWILRSAVDAAGKIIELASSLQPENLNMLWDIVGEVVDNEEIAAPSPEDEIMFQVYALSHCLKRATAMRSEWASS